MTISQQVNIIGQTFADALKDILGEKLYGAYIYGAVAFSDTLRTGDIDFHVILKSSLTDNERSKLEELHKSLAKKFPPLGGDLDGYYILLKDALGKSPPKSQMWKRATDNSWALHREHILAGRHIILYGPEPKKIYPPATWPEIETALYGELDYVEKHLQDYPDYCILNLCRLIYSFETKDVVVSKAQASNWAHNALPQWKRHIELARKSYARQATPEDRQFMLAEVGKFLEFAKRRIERASKKGVNNREEMR
jgi:predicted nucleotidyltransferase